MEKLYSIRDKLMRELEAQSGKPLSASSLEIISKAGGALKNILKVIRMMEDGDPACVEPSSPMDQLRDLAGTVHDEQTRKRLERILTEMEKS